jgi:hypothetical protein
MSLRMTPAIAVGRHTDGEEAAIGGAEEYGWRDFERDQDGREVRECDGKRVVVGVAIVLGSAVTAIIERQHKPRLGRVGHENAREAPLRMGPCGER